MSNTKSQYKIIAEAFAIYARDFRYRADVDKAVKEAVNIAQEAAVDEALRQAAEQAETALEFIGQDSKLILSLRDKIISNLK